MSDSTRDAVRHLAEALAEVNGNPETAFQVAVLGVLLDIKQELQKTARDNNIRGSG